MNLETAFKAMGAYGVDDNAALYVLMAAKQKGVKEVLLTSGKLGESQVLVVRYADGKYLIDVKEY